jgi:hypothetical protein
VKAFHADAVPACARASRRKVLDAKKMDILGLQRPGWNPSTYSPANRFPDRPLQRVLSAYDAPKRTDYNYRSEVLDTRSTERYIPKSNKLQVSARDFLTEEQRTHPDRSRPPKQRLSEAPIHPALESKTGWNPSTEPLSAKARAALAEAEQDARTAALSSAGYDGRPCETLEQREARFLEERREEKRLKAQLRASGQLPAEAATPSFYHITNEDFAEMTMQVPAKRITTWSLGSI